MGQVAMTLNGRIYRLACADGEEEQLRALSDYVKRKLEALIAEFGHVGEARLMLMSALLIADELFDARVEKDRAGRGIRSERESGAA